MRRFSLEATAPTQLFTLSLHDALPISATVKRGDIEALVTATGVLQPRNFVDVGAQVSGQLEKLHVEVGDRKSTRLNSSHVAISYAVFCLKKKKEMTDNSLK